MNHFMNRKLKGFLNHGAYWLGAKANRLSAGKKKIALALFCLVFGGLSIGIIFETLTGDDHSSRPFLFTRPKTPRHIGKSSGPPLSKSFLSPETFRRIESIKTNDSLMLAHPHLIDTIQFIEKAYQSQSKP
jgi:hypothetical protein